MRSIVLGHSIAAGSLDPEGGWPQRLTREFTPEAVDDPWDYHNLYNLAVSGFTTEDVGKQLPEELEVRDTDEEKLVIIQIGLNDPIYDLEEGCYRVSKEEFRENLENIIETVDEFADYFYVLEEPPVNIDGKLDWEQTESLEQQDIEEYEKIKREVCKENNVVMIELRSALPEKYRENLADGLHPNGKGHQMIADIVKAEIGHHYE